MANRYYQAGAERASRVEALFNAIAARYDLINDLQSFGLHRRWKKRLIRRAGIKPGETALDVCCGTGDISFGLAGIDARVVGVDFSAPMLRQAARRLSSPVASKRNQATPLFVRGDALRLPLRDDAVNVVTISYGLRNLANLELATRELHRVTRPGGRLLILDFGKPSTRIWRTFYFAYLRLVVPLFGRLFCGDADSYRYILESLEQYPAQSGIGGLLRGAGWADPDTTDILGGIMSLSVAHKRNPAHSY